MIVGQNDLEPNHPDLYNHSAKTTYLSTSRNGGLVILRFVPQRMHYARTLASSALSSSPVFTPLANQG
ncbi:hypothetical protein Pla52o_19460 [Novipirellula galeiformis]|uniref:Uncharacterized protein n=1 Tax=Novipirellula galeiformis TaxID=2528004 RepID=A0A5C6CGJ4_9BACT|nr:hypothetical protein Pla52o_19460 [Novipirellula galeiformis]